MFRVLLRPQKVEASKRALSQVHVLAPGYALSDSSRLQTTYQRQATLSRMKESSRHQPIAAKHPTSTEFRPLTSKKYFLAEREVQRPRVQR